MTEQLSMIDEMRQDPQQKLALDVAHLEMQISALMDECVTKSGLSHPEVASRLNVTESDLEKILDGERHVTVETLARVMSVLDLEVEVRVSRNGETLTSTRKEPRVKRGKSSHTTV